MILNEEHTVFKCDGCGVTGDCDRELNDAGDGRDLCERCFLVAVDEWEATEKGARDD
jgi:hypothetical protein